MHGTNNGYARHQYRGEPPCAECVAGKAEYDREVRARPENRKKIRARARAQHRATQKLVEKYRREYRQAYKGSLGDPSKRQRIARKAVIHEHLEEYQVLYLEFKEEEMENA